MGTISISQTKKGSPINSGDTILFKLYDSNTKIKSSYFCEMTVPFFPKSLNINKPKFNITLKDIYSDGESITIYTPVKYKKDGTSGTNTYITFFSNTPLDFKPNQKLSFLTGGPSPNFNFLNGNSYARYNKPKDFKNFTILVPTTNVSSMASSGTVSGVTFYLDKTIIKEFTVNCWSSKEVNLINIPKPEWDKPLSESDKLYDIIIYAISINGNSDKLLIVPPSTLIYDAPSVKVNSKIPPSFSSLGDRIKKSNGDPETSSQNLTSDQYSLIYKWRSSTQFDSTKTKIYAAVARYYYNYEKDEWSQIWLEKNNNGDVIWSDATYSTSNRV